MMMSITTPITFPLLHIVISNRQLTCGLTIRFEFRINAKISQSIYRYSISVLKFAIIREEWGSNFICVFISPKIIILQISTSPPLSLVFPYFSQKIVKIAISLHSGKQEVFASSFDYYNVHFLVKSLSSCKKLT